jgi:hypothetical protein
MRQIAERELARNGVVELANVPGPSVTLEPNEKVVRRGTRAAEPFPKVPREQGDVAATLT